MFFIFGLLSLEFYEIKVISYIFLLESEVHDCRSDMHCKACVL